jgi:hypothetical protein
MGTEPEPGGLWLDGSNLGLWRFFASIVDGQCVEKVATSGTLLNQLYGL